MSSSKVILVTGANRGIGFAIVQALVRRDPSVVVILASRRLQNAQDALEQIHKNAPKVQLHPLLLDVTQDESVKEAVEEVERHWGRLDVLINNAGFAQQVADDQSDFRQVWNKIYDVNVTSIGLMSTSFMPLLSKSLDPRVINISSGRASFGRVFTNPPTAIMAYSVSKAALNMMTVEYGKAFPKVLFQTISPGHCKTAFNGYRGKRDPLDGATVVVETALAARDKYHAGFWETDDQGQMIEIPW